ncbi:MAG: fructosamine kinase family protein [Solirubrobacteraceae bacterium]
MGLPEGVSEAARLGGGDINEAWRVRLRDGRPAFVKTRVDARPGEYAAEARGLRWLGEADALPVPAVIEVSEDFLVLQWIEQGQLGAAGEDALGRGLARLHSSGAPHFGDAHGAAGFGSLCLANEPLERWADFYAQRRVAPLTRIARQRGAITQAAVGALGRLCERMGDLAGPAEPPARLHGDLWWGNVLSDDDGAPWLIDPSAHGGHREVDLAMLRLFGGPRARVFDAYADVSPLAAGWEDRVELWQLAPLLVHAALFGGTYGAAVERVARRYAG